MSLAGTDITVEILKDIRDEIRGVRTELREEVHGLRGEMQTVRTELRDEIRGLREDTNLRFTEVEGALLDLAEQQRFIVRYTRVLSERDAGLEPRVAALEGRLDKLESK